MAVGCALPPFSSLWWFGFCLGPCAFNYREEDGNIRTPGWAVPPGVTCVGHVPALRVGFCIHQAAHLDTLAFAAPVPDVQPLAGRVDLGPDPHPPRTAPLRASWSRWTGRCWRPGNRRSGSASCWCPRPGGQPPAQPSVCHRHVRGHRHRPACPVGPLTAGVRAEPAPATPPGMLGQYFTAVLASSHALGIS